MPSIAHRALRLGALLALVLLGALPGAVSAQSEVVGRWEGVLETPQGNLTVVFEIAEADGGLTTTMYSPDQSPNPIPTQSTTFEDGTLVVDVPMVQGGYEGTLTDDGGIDGTWSQGGGSLPLNIEKVEG